jgi:hypothetical protein
MPTCLGGSSLGRFHRLELSLAAMLCGDFAALRPWSAQTPEPGEKRDAHAFLLLRTT